MSVNKQKVSWEQYYELIRELAKQIEPEVKAGNINQILALARGGNIVGDALSRTFNLPLAIMFTSSYSLDNKRGELIVGEDIAKQFNTFNDKILIVDDLVDSGATLSKIKADFVQKHGDNVKTAVLWKKTSCQFSPDYYVATMQPNDWIIQPFEAV